MNKRLIKTLIALLILVALIIFADPREVWRSLSMLTLEIVGYLLLLSVALIYISALKWKLFVDELGSTKGSVFELFGLYLIGYFVNLLVPSYVGGDVVRSWYVGKKIGQHNAFAATILERYTGFVAMVLLALCFMWATELVTTPTRITIIVIALLLVAFTAISLSPSLIKLAGKLPIVSYIAPHLGKLQEGLKLAAKNKKLLFEALLLSFLFHSLTVLNTIAAAYAVGWFNPAAEEIFVVLPIILLIGALPITPSGLGIQEGAFYYYLQQIGATSAQAIGVGLVLRAKAYVLALIGGVVWLFYSRQHQKASLLEAKQMM